MGSDQTATIVVAAVIPYEGRILIQERTPDNHPGILVDNLLGRWEYPGGVVLVGEDFEPAVKREVLEELGCEVSVHRLLHAQVNTYEEGTSYLVLFYHCTLLLPPPSLIGAHSRFVLPSQLGAFNPLPGTLEAAHKLGEVTEQQKDAGFREVFSFVGSDVTNQTPDETLHIATYELGSLIENHHKAKRYGSEGYQNDAKKGMSDLISMCRMYCEQKGWGFDELMTVGEEAYLERMEDLKKYGKQR